LSVWLSIFVGLAESVKASAGGITQGQCLSFGLSAWFSELCSLLCFLPLSQPCSILS